jgi:PHP family Zn ribbon phosphoesterase
MWPAWTAARRIDPADAIPGVIVLKEFRADLHIHTCLSPCADWEMSPRRIIRRSRESGLDLIAVCDHNSSENSAAVAAEGQRAGIAVIPGLEICSREEVHMLALFGGLDQAQAMQELVYAHLPGENRPEVFGYQIVANDADEVVAENPRLLIGATDLSVEQIVCDTHRIGGLCLAAHVDRPANGIIQQLGFIPPDLGIDGAEVSHRVPLAAVRQALPAIGSLTCLKSSDAHRLDDIGRAVTVFLLAAPTIDEVRLALTNERGRRVIA